MRHQPGKGPGEITLADTHEFVKLWSSPLWHRMQEDGSGLTRCQIAVPFMSGKTQAVRVFQDGDIPEDPCICCLTLSEREKLYEKYQ